MMPKITRELNREICKEHVLYKIPCCALGRRTDRDDFLFQIESDKGSFAIVHLTWQKETNSTWPTTELFNKFEECFSCEST